MSKLIRAHRNRLLKEKHDPVKRIQRITELKREIKMFKADLPRRKKLFKDYSRAALWAECDVDAAENEIERMTKELNELEGLESGVQS